MTVSHKILRVFVASPGDVSEERKLLGEVISEFNTTWADNHSTRLELIKWESHTHPDIDDDAQQVINNQIGDEYDIFIGLMWGRFGTKTNRANSGTEEEFDRAYERLKTSLHNVKIMFYFKDAPMNPSKIDPNQLLQVQAFKNKLSTESGALYREFNTPEDFKELARTHLSKLVQNWDFSNPPAIEKAVGNLPKTKNNHFDPLANLAAIGDANDDDGYFELLEIVDDAMNIVVNSVAKISAATAEIGDKMMSRGSEIESTYGANNVPNTKAARIVVDESASDLENFVQQLSAELPIFHKHYQIAMSGFENVSEIFSNDFEGTTGDIRSQLEGIIEFEESISGAHEGILGFRNSASQLPRMSTKFKRAKRRTVAVLDDLLAMLVHAGDRATIISDALKLQIDQRK